MSTTPKASHAARGYPYARSEAGRAGIRHEGRVQRMRVEVAAGLARPQKELPSKYFYDARGSRLFEKITRLPEYYLTRAERALLEATMPELATLCRPRAVTELGAGGATKTPIILDALRSVGGAEVYQPIDVSAAALAEAAVRLRREYPGLRIRPVVADFTRELPPNDTLAAPRLYVFLGSTIGNLEHDAAILLLRGIRAVLGPDDRFLLGVDLKKDPARLEAAYNDDAGVTAEFNRNILLVLNRELGSNFDPSAFDHHAFYDRGQDRIEMHLVSSRRQRVEIPGAGGFELRQGESIRTEISCKYDRARIDSLFDAAGLRLERWWSDPAALFALALAAPA